MMENFAQILRQLPTGDASSSSGGTAPFKVQINFDIPVFEGKIDKDVVYKWLNLIEGYFFSINFLIEKISLFLSSKLFPMSKIGWRLSMSKSKQSNPHYL